MILLLLNSFNKLEFILNMLYQSSILDSIYIGGVSSLISEYWDSKEVLVITFEY